MSQSMIDVSRVSKSFGKVHAVKSVDLQLKKGEYLALLGPNGAGKTTLVEMIEGIREPDRGEILIKGKRLRDNKTELYSLMGISFQETRLFEKITAIEILDMFASFYQTNKERVKEILKLVGLESKADSYTKNLSGGQRQKLALGIALLNDPEILMLDEPTTGLDPTARREIWDILMRLRCEKETSLILTTHYMEEASYLCDRIVIMDQGSVIAEGSLKSLMEQEKMTSYVEFSFSGTLTDPPAHIQGMPVKWYPGENRGKCRMLNVGNEMPALFQFLQENQLTVKDFEFHKPTLDELFLLKTGRSLVG